MKNALSVLLVLALSAGLSAQTHRARRTSRHANVAPMRTDLNSSLTDLDRVAMSSYADISALHIDRWGSQWRPGFLKSTRQKEAEHTAESVKRNLSDALPTLIADVRTAHGSVSSTFRLYHDLTLVGEAMDSLVSTAKFEGRQHESRGLADDCAALSRIRRNLSSYIEARAVTMDSKAATLASYSPAPRPRPAVKKIVIDDMSQAAPPPAPKKIIVDDDPQPVPRPVAARAFPAPKKIIIDDDPEPAETPAPAKVAPVSAPQPIAANVAPAAPAAQSQPAPANVSAPAPAPGNSLVPRKIIIDDDAPEAKPAKKKAVVQYSNL